MSERRGLVWAFGVLVIPAQPTLAPAITVWLTEGPSFNNNNDIMIMADADNG